MVLIDRRRITIRVIGGCLVTGGMAAFTWWQFGPKPAAGVSIGMVVGMAVVLSIALYEWWSMEGPNHHILVGAFILLVVGGAVTWVVSAYGPASAAQVIGIAAVASLAGSLAGRIIAQPAPRR